MTAQNPAQDVSDDYAYGLRFIQQHKTSILQHCVGASEKFIVERTFDALAARELQHNASELARAEAQVVGGKIANGHHCGLPEYLCKHPSHTPQSSAPVVGEIEPNLLAAIRAIGRWGGPNLSAAIESALTGSGSSIHNVNASDGN